jgi:hypothetical protein
MPDRAKVQKPVRTEADIRRERLAAELRANLAKRKQQARSRAAAAKDDDKPDAGPHSGPARNE